MTDLAEWATGDVLGLPIAIDPDTLRSGGPGYLTRAFRAAGTLREDDEIIEILSIAECEGGSTGRKLRLEVRYRDAANGLPTRLFVKFSRDLRDAIRDGAKIQMKSEVLMGLASRMPGFPVPVPRCMFADYETGTGTGILVTEEIAFGQNGIQPHREKCLDADLDEPLAHYRTLLRANARLAGFHRAAGFSADDLAPFVSGDGALGVSEREPYSAEQLSRRIERLREFAGRHPGLLPERIGAAEFIDRLAAEAPRFCGHEMAIARYLDRNARYSALCHWNANIDNAWFWRDEAGELQCGLLDWGNARVMNIGVALAGSLMAAEPDFLVESIDELIAGFIGTFAEMSGEALRPEELKDQMFLHIACSGLQWLIDAPAMIERNCPELDAIGSRFDPRFRGVELLRNQLHMLTVFLTLWRAFDFAAVFDRFVARGSEDVTRAG